MIKYVSTVMDLGVMVHFPLRSVQDRIAQKSISGQVVNTMGATATIL